MKKLVASVVSLLVMTSGCSSGSTPDTGSGKGSGNASRSGSLTVLAASSLTEAFGTLAKTFENQHPGVTVRTTFDSSATLAQQVTQGAPADVLATADTTTMATVTKAGDNAGKPQLFASNILVLVVPKDNAAHITSFADIGKPGVSYVMCVVTAPCGSLAKTELKANHISAQPKSQEVDVKSVLSKVELGEADAGLVYATDAQAAGPKVRALPIPNSAKYINTYPIVALSGSSDPALAKAWVDLVLSGAGQRVLHKAGFGKP
jgi:molybdate transport system substrate-binding protein